MSAGPTSQRGRSTVPRGTPPAAHAREEHFFAASEQDRSQLSNAQKRGHHDEPCCSCSPHSTCLQVMNTARSTACACRVSGRCCSSCACFPRCSNRANTTIVPRNERTPEKRRRVVQPTMASFMRTGTGSARRGQRSRDRRRLEGDRPMEAGVAASDAPRADNGTAPDADDGNGAARADGGTAGEAETGGGTAATVFAFGGRGATEGGNVAGPDGRAADSGSMEERAGGGRSSGGVGMGNPPDSAEEPLAAGEDQQAVEALDPNAPGGRLQPILEVDQAAPAADGAVLPTGNDGLTHRAPDGMDILENGIPEREFADNFRVPPSVERETLEAGVLPPPVTTEEGADLPGYQQTAADARLVSVIRRLPPCKRWMSSAWGRPGRPAATETLAAGRPAQPKPLRCAERQSGATIRRHSGLPAPRRAKTKAQRGAGYHLHGRHSPDAPRSESSKGHPASNLDADEPLGRGKGGCHGRGH